MSHLIFLIDCQFVVPEKMTVTKVFIQGIYIPLISVPEFAVTKVKIPEFSYNHNDLLTAKIWTFNTYIGFKVTIAR